LHSSDLVKFRFESEIAKFVERQNDEKRNSSIKFSIGLEESLSLCLLIALDPCRVMDAQCAVIGCPGHTGHGSAAAWSQTVKTKCMNGAPGRENSSQLLLRNPCVGRRFLSKSSKANEFTLPVG